MFYNHYNISSDKFEPHIILVNFKCVTIVKTFKHNVSLSLNDITLNLSVRYKKFKILKLIKTQVKITNNHFYNYHYCSSDKFQANVVLVHYWYIIIFFLKKFLIRSNSCK